VLNDLINYDKIEMDKFQVQLRVVDPFQVVEKTVRPLTMLARQRDIDFQISSDFDMPRANQDELQTIRSLRMLGDAVKFGQVVRNVVSNALKFTPRGGTIVLKGEKARLRLVDMCIGLFVVRSVLGKRGR
jgi:signal transduction histidine kinase